MAPKAAAPPGAPVAILATVAALGSLALHMILPGLPQAAQALGTDPGTIRLVLTVYIVALAGGQLACGPLADRWGRRPMVLGGGLLFVVGSLGCWAAPSVALLLAARVAQALGAAAGLVAGRAIAGDIGGASGRRTLALLTAIVLFSPMLAPMIGGFVAAHWGWRAPFALLALAGAGGTLAGRFGLRETWTSRASASGPGLLRAWQAVAAERDFRLNLARSTLLSAGLYIFLAAVPFLLGPVYHVAPAARGLVFGGVGLGAATGALAAGRLANWRSAAALIRIGMRTAFAAALLLAGLAAAGLHHPLALVGPMALYAAAGGLVMPNAMAVALTASGERIGIAVSLYGALQMAGSGLATAAAALLPVHDPVLPMAAIAVLAGAAALLPTVPLPIVMPDNR